MDARAVIAVDLGGTLLRTGVVTAGQEIIRQWTRRVGTRRGTAAIAALLEEAVGETYGWTRERGTAAAGVSLAVPGLVDPGRGLIRYAANLDVRGFPVAEAVRRIVPLPVLVENDVRAAAWGEWHWGAGKGASSLVLLSAGTGIAAALVWEGRLYRGILGAAGELGHVPVVPDGAICRCGHRGCLETVAGGWGIVRQAERVSEAQQTLLPAVPPESPLSAEAVFQAAAAGDPVAAAVIREAGDYLGRAAVALARLWNPARLVLGGGLLFSGSPLVGAVEEAVAASALYADAPPAVAVSAFEGNSGLLGAACLFLEPEPGHLAHG